ncbi:exoglucanase B precursor [mine drainage metagenome]|uniref:Exoglucanase B n=1 Tax=mine drainage metagenome TaxID=410659 RepID=A0A1J5TDF0_9ZZZZ
MKKIFFVLSFLSIGFISEAQADSASKPAIAIVARSYNDHIVLRYFAGSPALFTKANTAGYIIERALYKENIPFEKLIYTAIKGSPFKRWDETQWQSAFDKSDKNDSNNNKLAGFAMALSDSNAAKTKVDVLENGLQSLKEERDNQDMKFTYALIAANRSKMAAEGLALRVSDYDVAVGIEYVYRVCINDGSKKVKLDYGYVRIKCLLFNEKYLANNKTVSVIEGDEKVSFSFPESEEYYAFNVERSDDGGVTFKRITTSPTLKLKAHGYTGKSDYGYGDSSLTNYKKYYYRVFVSTAFADDLLLAEFMAMPRDKTPPPAPFLKSATHIKPKHVELIWQLNAKDAPDLKGFNVKRSDKIKGQYNLISKNILPRTVRNYIDESFDVDGTNYYVVEAVDTAGNISQSLPVYVTLIDSTPPAIPIISSAIIDSVGKIIIKVKPNTEKDFMGYQVLKANSKEHDFSVIEETFKDSLGHTTFIIYDSTTLNSLTKNIYYKLVAFDYHFNQSKPSKIIELKKRDTIPPVSPVITDFSITDTSVIIRFANSSSEDAVQNILLRKEVGKEKFDSVFYNNNNSVAEFNDTKIVSGKTYQYAMMAKDDGGLLSKLSNSIQLKTLHNTKIATPILTGGYDEKTKKVFLVFEIDKKLDSRKIKIEIYKRADKKSKWVNIKTVDADKNKNYSDELSEVQKTMSYMIRLIDEKNNTSNFSKELLIQL